MPDTTTTILDELEPIEFSEACHGVAHALAALHFGQTFEAVVRAPTGLYEVSALEKGLDDEIGARIAIAGPCADLAIALLESDEGPEFALNDELDQWLSDARYGHGMITTDLATAKPHMTGATTWGHAFAEANLDLIRDAAEVLLALGGVMTYSDFRDRWIASVESVSDEALSSSAEILKAVEYQLGTIELLPDEPEVPIG